MKLTNPCPGRQTAGPSAPAEQRLAIQWAAAQACCRLAQPAQKKTGPGAGRFRAKRVLPHRANHNGGRKEVPKTRRVPTAGQGYGGNRARFCRVPGWPRCGGQGDHEYRPHKTNGQVET